MDDLAKILPQPERQLIGTRREYLAAFDVLVGGLRRELRVFDPDGAQLELNAPARIALLRNFLLASRDSRLLIAVHDAEHLRKHSPRFLELLALFSASISIHRPKPRRCAHRTASCSRTSSTTCGGRSRRRRAGSTRGTRSRKSASSRALRGDLGSSVPAVSATSLGL